MRHLYTATNIDEKFNALVMAVNSQDALCIVRAYAAGAGIESEWSIRPTVPSVAKTMEFSCDHLLQNPLYEKDGVVLINDLETYYLNIYKLSQSIKIRLNNDMTLLVFQEDDGTIMSKIVMGQGESIEYTNIVSERAIDEVDLTSFITGNANSDDALHAYALQEAEYRLQKAYVKYTSEDVATLANDLVDSSEDWIDGQKLYELSSKYIRKQDLKPLDVTFTKPTEIIDYIETQYDLYGCEADLSSLYFSNVYVTDMSKRDILLAYRTIQKECNGDAVFELSDYSITGETITGSIHKFASDPKYDELYTGNLETFLTSFKTETIENTCFCRLLEYEEENGIVTGELLDFIF